ncbi:MAG: hypothetical protein P9F19_18230 [Candidatus Contendobacter sp.]|nr:hypothetical protein [Candidatus Contendobacter sp.]MDG4559305.1 hypothetical protein [Candidatus Contendobacter sp.]
MTYGEYPPERAWVSGLDIQSAKLAPCTSPPSLDRTKFDLFGYLTLEGALVPYLIEGDWSREIFMKELLKIAVCAVLLLALSPLVGFWIVALVGAGLLLLPIGAVVAKAFPETWKHIENTLFSRTFFPSAP